MQTTVRAMNKQDWGAMAAIWEQALATGQASFRTEALRYTQWDKGHLPVCRLVAVQEQAVIGWGALAPISQIPAYSGLAELSLYVDVRRHRSGVGSLLMEEVIRCSEQNGIWLLESCIMAENAASIALHKRFGFSVSGLRYKVARDRFGTWRDTVMMNRRSALACYD